MSWSKSKTVWYVLIGLLIASGALILYLTFKDTIDNKNLLYLIVIIGLAVLCWWLYTQWQKQKRTDIFPKQAMDATEVILVQEEGMPGGWVKERGFMSSKYKLRVSRSIFRWTDMRLFSSPAGGKFFAAEYECHWGDSPGIGIYVWPLSEGLEWVQQYGFSRFEHISLSLWLAELNHKRRFPFDHSTDKMYQLMSNLGDMDTDSAKMLLGSRSKGSMMSLPEEAESEEEPRRGGEWQRPSGSE